MKGYNCVTVTRSFEAAHMLSGYDGDCKNLHGHSYKVRVTIKQKEPRRVLPLENKAEDGMLMDFKKVKQRLDCVLADLDHAVLIGTERNPVESAVYDLCRQHDLCTALIPGHTTAENIALYILNDMALYILNDMADRLHGTQATAYCLTIEVQETEGCYATCSRNI